MTRYLHNSCPNKWEIDEMRNCEESQIYEKSYKRLWIHFVYKCEDKKLKKSCNHSEYIYFYTWTYTYIYKCVDKKFKKSCNQSYHSLSVFTILVTSKSHITCVQHADSNALTMQKAKLRVPSAKWEMMTELQDTHWKQIQWKRLRRLPVKAEAHSLLEYAENLQIHTKREWKRSTKSKIGSGEFWQTQLRWSCKWSKGWRNFEL